METCKQKKVYLTFFNEAKKSIWLTNKGNVNSMVFYAHNSTSVCRQIAQFVSFQFRLFNEESLYKNLTDHIIAVETKNKDHIIVYKLKENEMKDFFLDYVFGIPSIQSNLYQYLINDNKKFFQYVTGATIATLAVGLLSYELLYKKYDRLSASVTRLNNKIINLFANLNFVELRHQNQTYQDRIRDLNEKLIAKQIDQTHFESKITEYKKIINNNEKIVTELNQTIGQLSQQVTQQKSIIDEKSELLKQNTFKIDELKKAIQTSTELSNELKNVITKHEKDIQDFKEINEKLNNHATKMTEELKNNQNDIKKQKKVIKGLQETKKLLETSNSQIMNQNQIDTQRLVEQEKLLENAKLNFEKLQLTNAANVQTIQTINSNTEIYEAQWSQKLQDFIQIQAHMKDTLTMMANQQQQLTVSLAEKEQLIKELKQETESERNEKNETVNSNVRLTAKFNENKKKVEMLETEIKTLQEQNKKQIAQYESIIASLKKTNSMLQTYGSSGESLQNNLTQVMEQNQKIQDEKNNLQTQLDELNKSLHDLNTQYLLVREYNIKLQASNLKFKESQDLLNTTVKNMDEQNAVMKQKNEELSLVIKAKNKENEKSKLELETMTNNIQNQNKSFKSLEEENKQIEAKNEELKVNISELRKSMDEKTKKEMQLLDIFNEIVEGLFKKHIHPTNRVLILRNFLDYFIDPDHVLGFFTGFDELISYTRWIKSSFLVMIFYIRPSFIPAFFDVNGKRIYWLTNNCSPNILTRIDSASERLANQYQIKNLTIHKLSLQTNEAKNEQSLALSFVFLNILNNYYTQGKDPQNITQEIFEDLFRSQNLQLFVKYYMSKIYA